MALEQNIEPSMDAKLIAASNIAIASALWSIALDRGKDTPREYSLAESQMGMELGMNVVEGILEKMRSDRA